MRLNQALPPSMEFGDDRAMRIAVNRLRQWGGALIGVAIGVVGMGGPEDVVRGIRETINFLLRGTGYEAAPWISTDVLARPVQILFLLAAIAILVVAFWPSRSSRANPTLAKLYLECDPQYIPSKIPFSGEARILSIGDDLEDPLMGLSVRTIRGPHGATGHLDDTKFIVVCKLTNYGDSPIFNAQLPVTVTLFDTESDENGTVRRGRARQRKSKTISFPKVDAGVSSPLIFYIENRSPYFFSATFPESIMHATFGYSDPQATALLNASQTGGSGAHGQTAGISEHPQGFKSERLDRPISYEPPGVSLDHGALTSFKFGVINRANTLMRVRLVSANVSIGEECVGSAVGNRPTILGKDQTAYWLVSVGVFDAPVDAADYISASVKSTLGLDDKPQGDAPRLAEIKIEYDDVPPKGVRRSRVTYSFPPNVGGYCAKIIDQEEY